MAAPATTDYRRRRNEGGRGRWKVEERPSRISLNNFSTSASVSNFYFRLPPSAFRIFLRYWLPLISYSTLIVIQSHYHADVVPRLRFSTSASRRGYGLLGLLFCRATAPLAGGHRPFLARRAVLSAALFGLSDEIHQPSSVSNGGSLEF